MDEITAEFEVQALAPPPPLRLRPKFIVGAKTDLGRVRENNEDKFEYFIADSDAMIAGRGSIFICCDGMGGHAAGQIASELAAKTFIDVYLQHPSADFVVAATAAIHAANRYVRDISRAVPSRSGMGTTFTALIVVQDQGVVVHVGDSRLYRERGGEMTQLTIDHSWVEEVVRAGTMSREDAEVHPYHHVITRCIGSDDSLNPEVFLTDVCAGDRFLLCSDGIMNHVSNDEISTHLKTPGPSRVAWNLVRAAIDGGGSDNATALVVDITSMDPV